MMLLSSSGILEVDDSFLQTQQSGLELFSALSPHLISLWLP